MSIFRLPAMAVFIAAISTPVFAQNTVAPANPSAAQDASRNVLSDGARKRMNHYAAQALSALTGFTNADTSQENAISTMRAKVGRLIDAGTRSGLSEAQTALFFQAYTDAKGNQDIPAFFLDITGQLDSDALFSSVQDHFATATPQSVDVAAVDQQDLAAISSVAQRLNAQEPAPSQSLVLTVIDEPAAVDSGPQLPAIPAGASATTVAILERIKLRGQDWVIEIQEGDSLFQISEALYGDRQKFLSIYEANADALREPSLILVGQVLVLPQI